MRGLLLSRIPFRVPTEPVTAAQCEAIEAAGGDAFAEYMVPHAALRLKQGFGRLIRSDSDRGIVVILDSRLRSKFYGPAFIHSLPPCTVRVGPAAHLVETATHWVGVDAPRQGAADKDEGAGPGACSLASLSSAPFGCI